MTNGAIPSNVSSSCRWPHRFHSRAFALFVHECAENINVQPISSRNEFLVDVLSKRSPHLLQYPVHNTMKPVSLSFASLAALLSGVSGLARVSERSAPNPNCFPFGSQARLNADLQPPHVSREEWWCPQSDFYGFLGFSFPFQFTNEDFEVASISSHMQQMKRQFGATMIRMYIPESYTTQLWENVLEAAILNNLGVVVQVAFPISGNDASLFRENV